MHEAITFPLVLLVGVATGFFDSTVGTGGLISVPSLVFLGLPPQTAIATDQLGSLGEILVSFFKFHKAKKIVWKYVLPFSLLALLGSLIGAHALVLVDATWLRTQS